MTTTPAKGDASSTDRAREPDACLLRADESALEQVAELLLQGAPGFVIVSCDPALRARAGAYLEHKALSVVFHPPSPATTPDDVLAWLMRVATSASKNDVWPLAIAHGDSTDELLRALNWHREKLLGRGCTLLWLDGIGTLRRLREVAPDAYSFRDLVVILRGDDGVARSPAAEPERLQRARTALNWTTNPLERAWALDSLSSELRLVGRLEEARSAANEGLSLLSGQPNAQEPARLARASLYAELARITVGGAQLARFVRAGLTELQGLKGPDATVRKVWLLPELPGPFFGLDCTATEEALASARPLAETSPEYLHVLSGALESRAHCLSASGDSRSALSLLREDGKVVEALNDRVGRGHALAYRALAHAEAGNTEAAESKYREAFAEYQRDSLNTGPLLMHWARLRFNQGELSSAERMLREIPSSTPPLRLRGEQARIALHRGDASEAVFELLQAIRQEAEAADDHAHISLCKTLAHAVVCASSARVLDSDAVRRVAAQLAAEAEFSRALAGNECPFYAVEFLAWQSDLLLASGALAEAHKNAAASMTAARATYPDLAPFAARRVADCSLGANAASEVFPLVEELETFATGRGLLEDAAHLAAQRVRALAKLGSSDTELQAAIVRLQFVLERSGSLRVAAEVWLELGKNIDPKGSVDPMPFLDSAYNLYLAIEQPEGRCQALEAMGDVLVERGSIDEARRRFLSARAQLMASELRLRVPLLDSKLNGLELTELARGDTEVPL